jgi:hypothetical protein
MFIWQNFLMGYCSKRAALPLMMSRNNGWYSVAILHAERSYRGRKFNLRLGLLSTFRLAVAPKERLEKKRICSDVAPSINPVSASRILVTLLTELQRYFLILFEWYHATILVKGNEVTWVCSSSRNQRRRSILKLVTGAPSTTFHFTFSLSGCLFIRDLPNGAVNS